MPLGSNKCTYTVHCIGRTCVTASEAAYKYMCKSQMRYYSSWNKGEHRSTDEETIALKKSDITVSIYSFNPFFFHREKIPVKFIEAVFEIQAMHFAASLNIYIIS